MKKGLVFIALFFYSIYIFSENKTFIRDYTYQASESDSKITARTYAMFEVKKLLLEELGVYVESYVNYTIESQNGHISKDFISNEIKQMSVGITETKILEENWNGEQYYIRAEIVADPTDVVRRINQTLEKRQSDVVIDSLNILLANIKNDILVKNEEITKLNSQLNEQIKTNQNQKQKVDELNQQLISLKTQLSQYGQEEEQLLSEIDKIKNNLKNITTKAVSNASVGMTKEEVIRVCGAPRFRDDDWFNYGYVWLGFIDGILVVSNPVEVKGNQSVSWFVVSSDSKYNMLKR